MFCRAAAVDDQYSFPFGGGWQNADHKVTFVKKTADADSMLPCSIGTGRAIQQDNLPKALLRLSRCFFIILASFPVGMAPT